LMSGIASEAGRRKMPARFFRDHLLCLARS
jgi:hypothetical protein